MQDVTGIDITLLRSRRFKLSGMVVDSQGQPAASLTGVLTRPGLYTIDHFSAPDRSAGPVLVAARSIRVTTAF